MEEKLLKFYQDLIRIKSYSTKEENVVRRIRQEMEQLGYDDILEDSSGSIIGVMGNGSTHILFDSHIDTVEVVDEKAWTYPPFGAELHDGKIYGRGASDMKASAAASVYAAAEMKKNGSIEGKTVYICCSALEENFDGEGTYLAVTENNLSIDAAVICEPTHLKLSVGQRGRAVLCIRTTGVSAHGAAPEKGINAVYKMAPILSRVQKLSDELMERQGWHGSVALSKIESTSASLNAVADSCTIYLDRRTTTAEDEKYLTQEMDELIRGTDAVWEVYDAVGKSYRGHDICLHSMLPAWETDRTSSLYKAAEACYKDMFLKNPEPYKWDFSTNGVATAGKLHIPTIGFGAGIEKMAHQTDEYCPVEDLMQACRYFSWLPSYL